jgi:hypothetical protein
MTWHEAFAAYQGSDRRGERGVFPMSMVGGNGAGRVLNDEHIELQTGRPNFSGVRPTTEDRRNANELALREGELTERWLRLNGVTNLNDPKAAKDALDLINDNTYDFYGI